LPPGAIHMFPVLHGHGVGSLVSHATVAAPVVPVTICAAVLLSLYALAF
jgi:hypothetical protein